MELKEYGELAMKTAIFPKEDGYVYTALGLAGEAGEIANKVKKFIRDDFDDEEMQDKLSDVAEELGDVLWYVAQIATELDTDLETIARRNLMKLAGRKARGVLGGSGDDR